MDLVFAMSRSVILTLIGVLTLETTGGRFDRPWLGVLDSDRRAAPSLLPRLIARRTPS